MIESSIVFTFTDISPDSRAPMCEVMAQEIAHSYGLDHEMLASDPMTYLDYNGEPDVPGPDGVVRRVRRATCGITGTTCRATQNSVQLLL